MDAPLGIERIVDVDLPDEEMWRLIATADGWQEWLVDTADVRVAEGGGGVVVDDGVERLVQIGHVDEGRSISFSWAEPGDLVGSVVTIRLEHDEQQRRRLVIIEQWPSGVVCADCPLRSADRWDLRACLLCIASRSTCSV